MVNMPEKRTIGQLKQYSKFNIEHKARTFISILIL